MSDAVSLTLAHFTIIWYFQWEFFIPLFGSEIKCTPFSYNLYLCTTFLEIVTKLDLVELYIERKEQNRNKIIVFLKNYMVPEKELRKSSGSLKTILATIIISDVGYGSDIQHMICCMSSTGDFWRTKKSQNYFCKKCRKFAERSFCKLGVTKVYNMFLDFMSEVHHLVVTVMLSRGRLYHVTVTWWQIHISSVNIQVKRMQMSV